MAVVRSALYIALRHAGASAEAAEEAAADVAANGSHRRIMADFAWIKIMLGLTIIATLAVLIRALIG